MEQKILEFIYEYYEIINEFQIHSSNIYEWCNLSPDRITELIFFQGHIYSA